MCRYGRKHYGNPKLITSIKRSARRKVKAMLKRGNWDNIPEKVSVPYTD
jgi:hypothetical protein